MVEIQDANASCCRSRENAAKAGWKGLKRAGPVDLRFHELCHEAISRPLLSAAHRDPRMLFRYTQTRAEDATKLQSRTLTMSPSNRPH